MDEHEIVIRETLVHIQRHLDEPLTLDGLANRVGLSGSHFRAVFQALVGEPVYQHIRRLRLERAAQQLKYSEMTVEEVGRANGYMAREAFHRAFVAAFGCPPDRFRRSQREFLLQASLEIHWSNDAVSVPTRLLEDRGCTLAPRLVTRPAFRVAYYRQHGSYENAHRAWYKFLPLALAAGLLSRNSIFLDINYDDPEITTSDKIRYDAGVVLPEGATFQGRGLIQTRDIPASTDAVFDFRGNLEDYIEFGMITMLQWMVQSGYEVNGDCDFNFYRPPPQILTQPIRTVRSMLRYVEAECHLPIRPRLGTDTN
jgi:AraC family transcriptional regulator